MDVENVEAEEQAKAEAEFAAGFSAVRGDEPPAAEEPVVATEPEVPADTETPNEPPAEPQAEDDPIVPGLGLPASVVKAALAKAADLDGREAKIYGKFGELQRTINDLKGLQEAQKQNGGAGSIALSAQADKLLARVRAEYPELGELLAQDLGELSAPSPQVDVDAIVNERMGDVLDRIELIQIETKHPDWEVVRDSPEFALWKSGLDPAVAQKLDDSREAAYVNRALDAYKEWRAKAAKPADKSNRLAAAVTPQGIQASNVPSKTPEQEFEEGFKSVRGRRL